MLIQDNSNSIITKYISIFLKETFNYNIEVTSIYNNSTYNIFNINDNIIFNGIVAIPVIENDEETAFTVIKDYMFGYIFAVIGTVSTITLSDSNRTYIINNYSDLANEELLNNNITKLPILNFTTNTEDAIQFNTISKLNLNSVTNFKIYSINLTTGEIVKDSNNNYVEISWSGYTSEAYETWLNNPIVITHNSRCRNCNDLCNYIYQWLNSRYTPLFADTNNNLHNEQYSDEIILNCNIANYFISNNAYFNTNKLPFDIDNICGNFLLSRVISDTSTPDEIEYVQNLIRYNKFMKLHYSEEQFNEYIKYPGRWDYLHQLILEYQLYLNHKYYNYEEDSSIVEDKDNTHFNVVVPTGFLDSITEKYLLIEYEGDIDYGYYSESGRILRTT